MIKGDVWASGIFDIKRKLQMAPNEANPFFEISFVIV